MSTLTQKLVSNRTLTLIDDVSKDYSSFDQVKDIPVFLMVSVVFCFLALFLILFVVLGSAGFESLTFVRV